MNLVSIDLEMNNPTNDSKIIQLGYAIANVKNQKILLSRSIFINPNEDLTPFIIELTGITQEQVNNGCTLTEAYNIMCADIEKYQVNKHAVQWGTDHFELRNQLQLKWEDYIFRRRAHDIKSFYQLYAISQPNGTAVSGLSNSMKKLGLAFNGNQHDAMNDALNTLTVMFHLQNKFKAMDHIKKIYEGMK